MTPLSADILQSVMKALCAVSTSENSMHLLENPRFLPRDDSPFVLGPRRCSQIRETCLVIHILNDDSSFVVSGRTETALLSTFHFS